MSSYNFCPACGARLTPDARFCSECGAPLDSFEVDLGSADAETAGSADAETVAAATEARGEAEIEAEGKTQAEAKGETGFKADVESEAGAETNVEAGAETNAETDAEDEPGAGAEVPAQSLTAAVESTVRRSRRRMPLIVLVALALALTSAVAFAAYTVYNQVIVPAMQAQQATIESQDNAQASGEPESESIEQESSLSEEEAQAAYQVVIDDYRSALADYAAAASASGSKSNSKNNDEFSEKHPYIYTDRLMDAGLLDTSRNTLSYSFATFQKDEAPALLVRSTSTKSDTDTSGSISLIAVYALVNGEPVIVAETGHEHISLSLVDEKILSYFQLGPDQTGKIANKELYFDITTQSADTTQDTKESAATGWQRNMTFASVDGFSVLTKAPSCIHTIGTITSPTGTNEITVTHPDGSTTTTEGDFNNSTEALKAECLAAKQQSPNLNWQPFD